MSVTRHSEAQKLACGESLRYCIDMSRLSAPELRKRLGVSWQTFNRWINGETVADGVTLARISDILDCEMRCLVDLLDD